MLKQTFCPKSVAGGSFPLLPLLQECKLLYLHGDGFSALCFDQTVAKPRQKLQMRGTNALHPH